VSTTPAPRILVRGDLRTIADLPADKAALTATVAASPYADEQGRQYVVTDEAVHSQRPVFAVRATGEWTCELVWAAGTVYRISAPGWMPDVMVYCDALTLVDGFVAVDARDLIEPPGGATPVAWVTLTAVIASIDGKVATSVEEYLTTHPPTEVTDHGGLTGLADDDHPQYLTAARGDLRYPLLTDPRLTDSRTPTGAAGGGLTGTYPNPTVAALRGVTVSATAPTAGQVLTASSGTTAAWTTPAAGAGDATTAAKGVVQLAGDLAGTAAAPTVAKVNGTTPGATGLALLGAATAAAAKTTLALVKADVGLGSVDNTADADKPISTATATAIAALAPKVNPALTATTPAPVLTTVTTPALSGWTLTGSATYSAGSITVGPASGSLSTDIPVTNDTVYQIDLTTSASTGGDVTVTLGAASATYPAAGITSVTIVATETGTRTLTISGTTWSATVTGVTVKELTRLSPAATIGAAEARAWSSNTAVGLYAQRSLTTGSSNTAVGLSAQYSLTTGSNNTAVGLYAQYSLTTGSNNTAVGLYAQYSLTTGSSNTAVGLYAQYFPAGNASNATTTGARQTSVGTETGQSVTTQLNDITTLGYRALAGADFGTAVGSGAHAAHLRSVALGSTTTTTADDQVMVGTRDVEITSATRGVILRSPNGTRFRVTVTDAGALTVSAV